MTGLHAKLLQQSIRCIAQVRELFRNRLPLTEPAFRLVLSLSQ